MRARGTILSMSASLKIMNGDFPPSSRQTDFKLLVAAACIMRCPVTVDPVKLTMSMSMCELMAAPAIDPYPVTTLITPSGTPAYTLPFKKETVRLHNYVIPKSFLYFSLFSIDTDMALTYVVSHQ